MQSLPMQTLKKDSVCLYAVYKGTGIPNYSKRSEYAEKNKTLKILTRHNISTFLVHDGTKDKVADCVQKRLDQLEAQIPKHKYVSWETLEETWGKDWVNIGGEWTMCVSMLLSLKRIKNDDMNGWVLQDHNSVQLTTSKGPVVIVSGTNTAEIANKIHKVSKQYNPLFEDKDVIEKKVKDFIASSK
jgi:hypothetical protein